MLMRLQESHGGSTPQSPSPSPKEFECAIKECVDGDRGRVREMIGMARLGEYGMFMLMRTGIAALLKGQGLPRYRIRQVMAIDGHRLKHLIGLNEVLEFRLISEFKPKTVFDAYWMYTSLVTLRLPFIVKSRFDPKDICSAFGDEKLCHKFIAGFLIAESWKSTRPSRRFKRVGTTHPATVTTILSIANHLAKHGVVTKVRIDEKMNEVHFEFDGLPNDVRRFAEDVWENPTTLVRLTDKEFMTLLAGLMAGDGSVVWSHGIVDVEIVGNLEREKPLYAVVQGELKRRLGIEASLYERINLNAIILYTRNDDAVMLLRMLPPLIEPLKELRRQMLIRKDKLGTHLAGRLLELLRRTKGIHGLQSHQAIRFLAVLLCLRLIRLKEVEGRKYHILEIPTNPHR